MRGYLTLEPRAGQTSKLNCCSSVFDISHLGWVPFPIRCFREWARDERGVHGWTSTAMGQHSLLPRRRQVRFCDTLRSPPSIAVLLSSPALDLTLKTQKFAQGLMVSKQKDGEWKPGLRNEKGFLLVLVSFGRRVAWPSLPQNIWPKQQEFGFPLFK